MNFPDHLFPAFWVFPALALYAATLVSAVRLAPWKRLSESGQLNVWLGTIVTLTLMWSMKAGVQAGLTLHLLGATTFTLMFGRSLAILGLSIVLAAVNFNSGNGWDHIGLAAFISVICPVLVADAVHVAVKRWLPAHFFVYVFVAAFFGAALTVLATGVLSTSVFWIAGVYSLDKLLADYFPCYILLAFAEAWLNGAVVTLMVVYVPHWVGSFDDRHYLMGK